MPSSPAPRRGVYIRSGPARQNTLAPESAGGTPRKGWPFAEGSQNHLDETSAPWPRPSRPAPGKPAGDNKPDQ